MGLDNETAFLGLQITYPRVPASVSCRGHLLIIERWPIEMTDVCQR